MTKNDMVCRVNRDRLACSLITGFFEEVLLIDCETEKVINVLEVVFNRGKKNRKYDGESYDDQVVKTLRDTLMETERNTIERSILLSVVKSELETREVYTVSFTIASSPNESVVGKEFVYKYLDENRDVIVLQCSDVTDVFFKDLDAESRGLLALFREAVVEEQFEIWFQPKFDFYKQRLIGAEALVRWKHPQKGIIAPDKFIPLFEDAGCIGILDEYVFTKVCSYMATWRDELLNGDVLPVSVNLSRSDIFYNGLYDDLMRITGSNKLSPSMIHIEITESAYIQNSGQLTEVVDRLRKVGFKIAMDDFGSGYSSLNTLKDINIDTLKLDMKFLSSASNSDKSKIILSSVIDMAKKLNLSVIAEGIETLEQAEMLGAFGCAQMQGYYFGRPMPVDEFEIFLKKHV